MIGQSHLLQAGLSHDDPVPLEDPRSILQFGSASQALSNVIQQLCDDEEGYGIWQTQTRIDANAWFFKPRLWLVCTSLGLHGIADAPSWLKGTLVQRHLKWSAILAVRYNDIMGQVIIQTQAQPVTWPPLTLDPVDGYAVAALCERFVHDS